MVNYKISIIIPLFNIENHIEKTLNSLEIQSIGFNNLEIILVDDNSTDNTKLLTKEFADKYSNVKLICLKKNHGFAGKPRNVGLTHASSEYIMFLDGDDYFLETACETLYNKINSTNVDLVIGGHTNLYPNGKTEDNFPHFKDSETYFRSIKNPFLLNSIPALSSKIFRKNIINNSNIRFLEDVPGQDLVFFSEYLLNSKNVLTLNNFTVYIRVLRFENNDKSVSNNISKNYLYGLIKTYYNLINLFEEYRVDSITQRLVFSRHIKFFSKQVLKNYNDSNNYFPEIFNSILFNNLKNKKIFIGTDFNKYFNNMSNGIYNNEELFNNIDKKIKRKLLLSNLLSVNDKIKLLTEEVIKYKIKLLKMYYNNRRKIKKNLLKIINIL